MVKLTYVDFIKAIQNEETTKLIGKIDFELLNSKKLESLYYSFPLIERMVLEIYKLVPDSDVEHYEQGIMKTVISIIDNNKIGVLPQNTINIIKKYFCDSGLRNELFHVKDEVINIEVSFDEINYIIMQLLSILRTKILENNDYNFQDILLLKEE